MPTPPPYEQMKLGLLSSRKTLFDDLFRGNSVTLEENVRISLVHLMTRRELSCEREPLPSEKSTSIEKVTASSRNQLESGTMNDKAYQFVSLRIIVRVETRKFQSVSCRNTRRKNDWSAVFLWKFYKSFHTSTIF